MGNSPSAVIRAWIMIQALRFDVFCYRDEQETFLLFPVCVLFPVLLFFLLLRCLTILWPIEESKTRTKSSWNTTVHKGCWWGYSIFSNTPVNVLAANSFMESCHGKLIHDSFHYGTGIFWLFALDSYFLNNFIDLDLHYNISWLCLIWMKSSCALWWLQGLSLMHMVVNLINVLLFCFVLF